MQHFVQRQKQGLIPRYFSVAFLVGSQKAREQTRVWQLACNSRNRESSCSSLAVRPQQPLPAPRQAALKSRRNQLSLVGGHVVPLQHLAATTAATKHEIAQNSSGIKTGSQFRRGEGEASVARLRQINKGSDFRLGKAFGSDSEARREPRPPPPTAPLLPGSVEERPFGGEVEVNQDLTLGFEVSLNVLNFRCFDGGSHEGPVMPMRVTSLNSQTPP